MRTPQLKPTQALLEQAWRDLLARRYACVAGTRSVDEALARHPGGALVRMHARLLADGLPCFREELPNPLHQLVRQASSHPRSAAPAAPKPPAPFDRKRAAAGDLDDD